MAENNTILYGDSLELISISNEELINNIADIHSGRIAIFRKNAENRLVTIPADRLEQFLGDSLSEENLFYVEKHWKESVKLYHERNKAQIREKTNKDEKKPVMDTVVKYGDTGVMLGNFELMSIEEREMILDDSIETLHHLQSKKSEIDINSIVKMVEVIANTFYANYANLDDNLTSDNIKESQHGIFVKTGWVIQIIIELFKNNGDAYENYAQIDRISTGSYTIDNINRGLLWFVGFCLFINDYIDQGLVTKKIRGEFKEKYSRYYRKRMTDDMITIERIIKGGMRRLDLEKELPVYAAGALLYDIGKIPFIGYHDSDEDYDENTVKIHVLLGYNMIIKTKIYPYTVAAMAAFHHEYYGGKGSYNFTNPVISKFTGKKRSDNARYFITYNEKEFMDGVAMAFLPCKIIEIIDVYNALVYKKNSHFETLKIIKKNFIAQSLKVDPIIFELLLEFKQKCGFITINERKEIDTIIY